MRVAARGGLRTSVSGGLAVQVDGVPPLAGLEVVSGGRCGVDGVVVDFALLKELLCVQSVESPQVMHHGHQLGEDRLVLGVLRHEDAVEDHLQLVLDAE